MGNPYHRKHSYMLGSFLKRGQKMRAHTHTHLLAVFSGQDTTFILSYVLVSTEQGKIEMLK